MAIDRDIASGLAPSATGRLIATLQAEVGRIEANWTVRVANLPTFRSEPDMGLDVLQGVMPDVLRACCAAVAVPTPALDPAPLARARELAGRHGRNRAAAGFALGDLLSEFHQLLAEVWQAAWRAAEEAVTLMPALREVQERVIDTLDAVVVAAAEAWLAAQTARREVAGG